MLTTGKFYYKLQWQICFFILFFSFSGNSQSRLDSLQTIFEQETNDSLKIIYELQYVRELHRREHDADKEYVIAQDAIKRALNYGDTLLYARSLDNMGLLYRYHQDYSEAMPLHIKAFNLVKNKDSDPVYKMIFANNAGVAGRYNQKFDSAITYYMHALRIAERENDLKNIAISSNGIGNTLGNIPGREEEALGYFERSLEAEKARDNSLGVAMNYLSISDYYIDKEQYKTARQYLDELHKINKDREDLYGLAITYEFYGKSYLEEGTNLEKAAFYFQDALSRFRTLGDKHRQAQILMSLGDVFLAQNDFAKATGSYRNSLALARELDQHGLIMANSFGLSNIFERRNLHEQALHYYKQGKAYEDSIKLSEQHVEIAALIRKYDIEKKENQIQLLEKDKALQQTLLNNQEQKLERRRIFMVLMGIGLLFILTIIFLQYRNARTKKKTNARILEEEKAKLKAIYERNLARAEILVTRLRINPHFLFNSLNAITYLIQSEQNAKAMKYLVVFSRYTRMVLETSQQHVVPLTEELKLTRYYLALEENRFEKDFKYEIRGDDSPTIEHVLIPPLLLQPFIENAIWHGLLPSKRDEKVLLLEVISEEKNIRIIIDDNGIGRKNTHSKSPKDAHKSMGMKIIKERIDLYNKSYPDTIEYEVIDKVNAEGEPAGTRIVFILKREITGEKPVPFFSENYE